MNSPSFFEHLADRLALAVYDTNQELRQRRLTKLRDEIMQFRITEPVFFLGAHRQPGDIIDAPVGPYRTTIRPDGKPQRVPQFLELDSPKARMSVIDRIKQKALQARSIAPEAIKAFEADLDGLIAEGPKLHAAREAAVSQHVQAFAGIHGEIDGLKGAIDILSNGGDPLPASGDAPKV